jgi:hypothetical protein
METRESSRKLEIFLDWEKSENFEKYQGSLKKIREIIVAVTQSFFFLQKIEKIVGK